MTRFGALVQLVRIHACHAWGHGFESRTHRKQYSFHAKRGTFFLPHLELQTFYQVLTLIEIRMFDMVNCHNCNNHF